MRNLSLYNKIFLIFTATMLISISFIGWYGMNSTSEAYLDSAFNGSTQNTLSLNLELERKLETVPKDILYTSNFYALKRYLIWNSMGEEKKARIWKQIYSDALVDFLYTKKMYYKARVIGLDGKEIINIEYHKDTDETILVKDNLLQDKKNKDYVKKTKKLKRGEFYVSPMDLNMENGKIVKPYTPVVRYATPIVDLNNELVALFVASVYAEDILDILNNNEKINTKIRDFLVDKDGDYLYNIESSKRWNHQLKNGFNFNKEHINIKENFKNDDSGVFQKNNKIYSFKKVYPLKTQENNYWYVISSIDEDIALAKLDEFKTIFITIFLLVILGSFFIVRTFVTKITTPLTKVTEQLRYLADGEIKKENIVYNYNDEIGNIVKSTSSLVNSIEDTIKQATLVANGEFSSDIKLLSKNDQLGLAIKNMTTRLKEITELSTSLARGNYDVNIVLKSSEDKLGLALMDMVNYLKTITNIAESISLGELDVKYKAKGKDDRLGYAILQMIKYLKNILTQANAISKDDFSASIAEKSKNDELGIALMKMTDTLRESSIQNKNEIFFNEGIGEFSDRLTGISDTLELSKEAITTLCRYVKASSGVLYTYDKEKDELNLVASFAFTIRNNLSNNFKLGHGVVGQVALEREPILLKNVKDEEFEIHTGTTIAQSKEIYTFPLIHEGELFGVIEIMSFNSFSEIDRDYLSKASSVFAAILHTTIQNDQIKMLLEKSQNAFNELQIQSEELQESNVQMEEQQQQLKLQSQELQEKNDNLANAKQEIDRRAEDLEKASKYKSEFLANMSHELRTPLNSIILLSKLLTQNQNDTLNEKDVEKSIVINKAGNDLLYLINDILDLSKIESGHMELEYINVQSSEIIEDVNGLFNSLAEEKNIKFIIEDNYNSNFSTDKAKLLQVLKNLLSNAFKFTKDGEVLLRINHIENNLIIDVKDTGIGIPNDKLDTIFEAFKQVDGSISREFGGTGLGLSISKTIVDLMGGNISVSSKFGEGTTFSISIKLNKKLQEEHEIIDEKVYQAPILLENNEEDINFDSNELDSKNILLVDDDSRNIFTLTSLLENAEAEVYSAFNGKEAIEILETGQDIDLILMDIMMPVMDGLEAIRSIKSNEKFKDIPIIAITAKNMPEDKQSCLDVGANDYLAKPLNHSTLVSSIKAWIK